MFQFTGFPSCHYLFMTWWHAVNVPRFRIRKSMGHCLLAADHGLSQLTTSFFGSWCQGIHPMLFIAWSLVLSAILTHEFRFRARALRTLAFAFVIISFFKIHWNCSADNLHYLSLYFLCLFLREFTIFFMQLSRFYWWAQVDSNHRPRAYQARALTTWAMSPNWWRWGGSNSWPPACKAGALPAELHPHMQGLGTPLCCFKDTVSSILKIEQKLLFLNLCWPENYFKEEILFLLGSP